MFWIPAGFAHGFRVVSEGAHVLYKATDFYHPECERTLAWNDPDVNVEWRLKVRLSSRRRTGSAYRFERPKRSSNKPRIEITSRSGRCLFRGRVLSAF